jgi:hypothetical protein
MSDDLTPSHFAGGITFVADTCPAGEPNVPDAPVGRYEILNGIGTVIDNNELGDSIILTEKVL